MIRVRRWRDWDAGRDGREVGLPWQLAGPKRSRGEGIED